jgi:DGQHR domain-containing protein
MVVDREFVQQRFGPQIDFGACFVGKNLNLQVLRGYAHLDRLAVVSAPDVYDMEENPNGTQRVLDTAHARACRDYAVTSDAVAAEEEPRFFAEILLNVRDLNVVELYNIEDPTELYEFDSFADDDEVPSSLVGVRVILSVMDFPKPKESPHVSRVDGNHRLWGVDELMDQLAAGSDGNDPDEFPVVAYSLLVGLDPTQEARLFRDINGEHKGMDVTHLDQLMVRITDPEVLKANPKTLPLWIADQLSQPGRAFDGMVFRGGAKEGMKRLGEQRPVKLNSLKSTVAQQLKAAPKVSAVWRNNPDALLTCIDNFWKAVRLTFPEAWENRREYILLQAIGLGAMAKFGGSIIDSAFEAERLSEQDFESYLAPVRGTVSLKREAYPGIAGAGGAQLIADRLLEASEPDAVRAARLADKLLGKKSESEDIDEKLGLQPVGGGDDESGEQPASEDS